MKFIDLCQHLHQLRFAKTKRSIGSRMTAFEVWNAAIACPLNGISEIYVKETELPLPFDGLFARLSNSAGTSEIACIYVRHGLEPHWQEFAVIKELMHCWSPGKTYVGTPQNAKSLVTALVNRAGKYTASVAADDSAVIAAAEVMLPHFTLERHIAAELPIEEIAVRHNLHPDIARMICSIELLPKRKNGSL